jgi:hypothetical protein
MEAEIPVFLISILGEELHVMAALSLGKEETILTL